jgi:putative DNA primase/helicase
LSGRAGWSEKCQKQTSAKLDEFLRAAEALRQMPEQLAALAQLGREEKNATSDAGAAYAERMLRKYTDELAAMTPGSGRNEALNKFSFHMGAMVARGWIARETVEETLRRAAEANGQMATEREKTLDTLKRALDDGEKQPHPDPDEWDNLVTEDSAAIQFAEHYRGDLLFDHDAGWWYAWTGARWAHERTGLAFTWARELVREISRQEKARIRYVASKAGFASAVERFTRADRAFAVTQDVWDCDRFLLGTPGGTVDLRTGRLRAAHRDHRITKLTNIAPAETPDCPLWNDFLRQATMDDEELVKFLQLLCGYALTGDTREDVLVFVYGPGGNGKSVFINTIAGIMGDYAAVAAMETFTATHTDRHPTDLAMLRGARLVTAAETEEGRAWAETRVKQMTGGDPITARFMRRDFFTYLPSFKLVIVGNHQPNLNTISDATRRRFAIVPFVHKPPTPDRDLDEKLKAEWPGILRWAIQGCLDWQANGLTRPAVVRDATENYFAEQDMFGQWLDQSCEPAPTGVERKSETSAALFYSWTNFARAAGEEPGSRKAFAERMAQRGRPCSKDSGGTGYISVSA